MPTDNAHTTDNEAALRVLDRCTTDMERIMDLVIAYGCAAVASTTCKQAEFPLANRLRTGLGLEPGDSAIVSAEVPDGLAKLERAGIIAAERHGRLRTSWHVYNDEADVDRVLDVLVG